MKKIVTIGGGTGSFVVLSGLKKYPLDLTAVVSVADDGGSSGRLRDEFGFLPVGDLRQCLAALAADSSDIRKILLYRFSKGQGLAGHNLGNLILTSLTDLYDSAPKAIEAAAKIFRLKGKIFPITSKEISLLAFYENGQKVVGEHQIDVPPFKGGQRIIKLTVQPPANIYPLAKKAIAKADLIILNPGDLYTSLLPNFVINGFKTVIKKSQAKIVYVLNLMTRFSQTHNFTAQDYVNEVENYLGRLVDVVLVNKAPIPAQIIKLYQKEKGYPIPDDLGNKNHFQVIRKKLLAPKIVVKPRGDVLQRSYLRHDPQKLAKAIVSFLKS